MGQVPPSPTSGCVPDWWHWTIPDGCVETGIVKPGMVVTFGSNGLAIEVKSGDAP